MEEDEEKEHVPIESCQMKHVVTLSISEKRICAVFKQQVDDIEVTSLCSPHSRSRDGFAAFCVDLRAGFDEVFTERIVIVDCSPLSTCQ